MLTSFPSATAFALALGARLTLRGLTLRRNPWTFGDSVSHAVDRYSCQHSRFRYLHTRSRAVLRRPTERSATTPESRYQKSDIRTAAMHGSEHPGDLPVLTPPAPGRFGIEIAEIPAIERPHLHLIGRSQRHDHKAAKLRFLTGAAGQTPPPG
jgi:hypothetical protein